MLISLFPPFSLPPSFTSIEATATSSVIIKVIIIFLNFILLLSLLATPILSTWFMMESVKQEETSWTQSHEEEKDEGQERGSEKPEGVCLLLRHKSS